QLGGALTQVDAVGCDGPLSQPDGLEVETFRQREEAEEISARSQRPSGEDAVASNIGNGFATAGSGRILDEETKWGERVGWIFHPHGTLKSRWRRGTESDAFYVVIGDRDDRVGIHAAPVALRSRKAILTRREATDVE